MVSAIQSSNTLAAMHRPDPSQLASRLFSQLDTKNQGYIEKSDLQSAFDKIASQVASGSSSASVDDVFSQLDHNSDGKVTKDEMSSSLKKLAEELDQQFNALRMSGFAGAAGAGGMGGMPPPPPDNDTGFTKDELSAQLQEIGTSDSKRSSLIQSIVNNFDQADSDGDGKVSFKEAMAYAQANASGSASSTGSTGSTGTASTAVTDTSTTRGSTEAQVLRRIMQLIHAYGATGDPSSSLASTLATTA